ncbi:MAG: hypothetical protein P9L94_04480 [Candidatus Hinthialibacter antarcticus]|nr:hypothetical protein [Candidatus Hinthialibacter antarcticus]
MKFHERLKQTRKRRYGAKEGDEEEDPKPKGPNCHNCVSFEITWDFKFPYGCKAMGFKTRKIPTMEVYEASGFHCQKFQPKNKKK